MKEVTHTTQLLIDRTELKPTLQAPDPQALIRCATPTSRRIQEQPDLGLGLVWQLVYCLHL